jgi:hypothetical protein
MKKHIFFLSVILLTFSACASASQTSNIVPAGEVPETSEVLPIVIPTPILHPDFVALQESIAASSGRFSLHPDGLLYDGENPIPGVTVAPDGTMTITVDGETVALDPADVDFDDEKGITIKGYELDEETGAWVEVNETVTIGGVTLTLDENGVVTEMSASGTEAEQAEKLFPFDATNLGFAPDATVLMMVDDKLTIVDADDHSRIIAQWGVSDTTGMNEMIYDFSQMVGEDGENVLLKVGKTTEMQNGVPKNTDTAFEQSNRLDDEFASPTLLDIYSLNKHRSGTRVAFDIMSLNRKMSVLGFLIAFDDGKIETGNIDLSEGILTFELKGGGFAKVAVINFDAKIRPGKVS